jgi:hypothetical protein
MLQRALVVVGIAGSHEGRDLHQFIQFNIQLF